MKYSDKQIRWVRPLFFYDYFSAPGKALYRVLFGLILVAGLFLLVSRMLPHQFLAEYNPMVQSQVKEVVLEKVENNYRAMNLVGGASYNYTSYAATPMVIPQFHLWLSIVLVTIAWSAILAACTQIRGLWGFLGPALFGVSLFLGQYSLMLFHTDPRGLLTFAALVPVLALFYVYNNEILKGNLVARWLAFFGLLVLYQVVAIILVDAGSVHKIMFSGVYVHLMIVALGALMLSKAIGHGLILWATNAKAPAKRWRPGKLMAAMAVLLVLFFYNFLYYNNYVDLPDIYIRPTYFLIIGALLVTITGQNAFHQLRDLIESNLAFTLLIGGLSLFVLSTLAFHFGMAEYMLIYGVERILSTILFVMLLAQLGYLIINFYPYLRRRQNIYYVFMAPPVYRFFAVWIIVLTVPFILEALTNWSFKLDLKTARANVEADNMLMRGNPSFAMTKYEDAASSGLGDLKSNYNAAVLSLQYGDALRKPMANANAIKAFRTAQTRVYYPPASINYANFVMISGNFLAAQNALKRTIDHKPSSELYVALADAYRRNNQPDSALAALKRAIELDDDNAILYSNLAGLYLAYDRPKDAQPLLKSAVELDADNAFVAENELFYHLAYTDSVVELRTAFDTVANTFGHNQNYVLMELRAEQDSLVSAHSKMLSDFKRTKNVDMLRIFSLAATDSIQALQSRLQYIKANEPSIGLQAHHTMGVLYHKYNVPEMAGLYFALASEYESDFELFNLAQMEIDAGNYASAYDILNEVKLEEDNAYGKAASQEMAILRYASGEDQIYLDWDFEGITRNQAMRMGVIAGRMGNLTRAIQSFKRVTDTHPNDIAPYIELARITMRDDTLHNLSFAKEQLDAGAKKTGIKSDPRWLAAYTQLMLASGKPKVAQQYVQQLKGIEGWASDAAYWEGRVLEARNSKPAARKAYENAFELNKFDKRPVERLADLMMDKRTYLKAVELTNEALTLNSQSPELWRLNGDAYLGLSLYEDAMQSFRVAMELAESQSPEAAEVYEKRYDSARDQYLNE